MNRDFFAESAWDGFMQAHLLVCCFIRISAFHWPGRCPDPSEVAQWQPVGARGSCPGGQVCSKGKRDAHILKLTENCRALCLAWLPLATQCSGS